MRTKRFIAIILLAATAVALIVTSAVTNRRAEHRATPMKLERSDLVAPADHALPKTAPTDKILGPETRSAPESPKPEVPQVKRPQSNSVETAVVEGPKPKNSKPPIQDPVARVALGFVGADPDAEEYWYYAIN